VCDAYGAGFFYIPGTETCLSINGYVWFQVSATSKTLGSVTYEDGAAEPWGLSYKDSDGWGYGSRVRINFDARSQTELGTLRGWMRLQASWNPTAMNPYVNSPADNDGTVGIDQAFVQLGGFVAGYGESTYFYQFNNSKLNYGSFSWDGLGYGYQERPQIRYEFGGKTGFYGAIALEAGLNSTSYYSSAGVFSATGSTASDANYMPDIVGRIGYSDTWGAIDLVAAYDDHRNPGWLAPSPDLVALGNGGYGVDGEHSAFSIKGDLLINIPSMPGSAFKVAAYYNTADSSYGPGSPFRGTLITDAVSPATAIYGQFGQAQWSAMASFLYQATPDLGFIVSGQYYGNAYIAGSNKTTKDFGISSKAWQAELEAVWTPVKNFEVRPYIKYTKMDHVDGVTSGFLRFTRYF
jgi:hypothetical protein